MTAVVTLADGTRFDLEWEIEDMVDALNDVSLETLARSISKQCRYNGSCENYFSVARHSAVGAKALHFHGADAETCRSFLIHDLHEAIIGDIVSPVSRLNTIWAHKHALDELKAKLDVAIGRRFGIPLEPLWCASIKEMDSAMFWAEWLHLMPTTPEAEGISKPVLKIPEHLIAQICGKNYHWRADLLDFMNAAEWLKVS